MFRPAPILALLLVPFVLCAQEETFWIEKPVGTNFPDSPSWEILSEGKAPGVMHVKDASLADTFFIEYEFHIPAPGGKYDIWGRSYDPAWSSPARWRIDEEPWREWTPEPSADRKVFQGTYVMQWHPWNREPLELSPGTHRLRLELTGAQAKLGDVPFFVLDALVVTKGGFVPDGSNKADAIVSD